MRSLIEWEKHFISLVKNVSLLGNIELTQEEFYEIREQLKKYIQNYGYISLKNDAPLTLAVFLVRIGIEEYSEGNFWSAVSQSLDLPVDDQKWQRVFGDSFLETLNYFSLPMFDTAGLKYVTPILAHGQVPNCYLENFFDVIFNLFSDNLNEHLGRDYVENIVRLWREDYLGRQTLQHRLDEINLELKKINEELDKHSNIIANWPLYEKMLKLKDKILETDELSFLLQMPKDFLKNTEKEIEVLKSDLHAKLELAKIIEDFNKQYSEIYTDLLTKQDMLDEIIDQIEILSENFTTPLTERIGDEILALSLDRLNVIYNKYSSISRYEPNGNILYKLKVFITNVLQLIAGKKKQEHQNYLFEIKELTANIPFKEEILQDIDEVYQSIVNLRRLYTHYFTCKEEIESLNIILKEKTNSLLETAAGIDVITSDFIISTNGVADLKLETEIDEIKDRISHLESQVQEYKIKLIALGKGDLSEGARLLIEQRNYQKEMSTISKQINTEKPFEKNYDNLLSYIQKLKNNRNILKELAEDTEQKLKIYPEPPLRYLNESAKKFIYFGEDIATDFVYNTAKILNNLLWDEDIEQVNLPEGIRESAKEWAAKHKEELIKIKDRENENREYYFKSPIIYYDSESKEIKAKFPQQKLLADLFNVNQTYLNIYTDNRQMLLERENIRLYSHDTYLSTEEKTITLAKPSNNYVFDLESDDGIIQTWIVSMLSEEHPFIVFDENGKKIDKEKMFEANRIIFIVNDNFMVEPSELVEGEEYLFDGWADYKSYYINLTNFNQIIVTNGEDIYTYFRKQNRLMPTLIGANKLKFLKINDSPVYLTFAPDIVFSEEPTQLRLWHLSLKIDDSVNYYPLEELINLITIKNGIIKLPLSKLNTNTQYGHYKLLLEKRGTDSIKCDFAFSVLPETSIKFDKEFYKPSDKEFYEPSIEKNNRGNLQICSPFDINFTPALPTQIAKNNTRGECIIEFEPCCKTIDGELTYLIEERTFTFSSKIVVPSIRWRENNSRIWNYDIKELWHEDISSLSIFIPIENVKKVILYINNREQQSISNISNKTAIFDITNFRDSFRENKGAVQEIFIEFPERKDIAPFSLAKVRTRWEVSNVEVKQKINKDKRIIEISWDEKGRTGDKVINFWDIASETEILSIALENSSREVVIERTVDVIPTGVYRIQFSELNPWKTTISVMPESGEINTVDVLIGDSDEKFTDIIQHGIRIAFLSDDKNTKLYCIYPSQAPLITKIEKVKGSEIETEYQGLFNHVSADGKLAPIATNPVRFLLDIKDMSMPYLIDCDGDGAMYCPKCQELFWEVREEHKKHHIEPRKIFFYISK